MQNGLSIGFSLVSIFLSVAGRFVMHKITKENESASLKLSSSPTQDKTHPIEVLIPARNEENYIRECVERIFNQNYPAVGVIVIDDNSTDNTPNILVDLKEK